MPKIYAPKKLVTNSMKPKKETISFLFPSHMAYGYHGDDQKIGINQPIICTVTLKDIQQKFPQSVEAKMYFWEE